MYTDMCMCVYIYVHVWAPVVLYFLTKQSEQRQKDGRNDTVTPWQMGGAVVTVRKIIWQTGFSQKPAAVEWKLMTQTSSRGSVLSRRHSPVQLFFCSCFCLVTFCRNMKVVANVCFNAETNVDSDSPNLLSDLELVQWLRVRTRLRCFSSQLKRPQMSPMWDGRWLK